MGGCCSSDPPHKEVAFEVGIKEKRSCHDVIFIILFVIFWAGMFYVASLAVPKGNPYRLIYGVDYEGNVCGTDNHLLREYTPKARDMTTNKVLYFLPGGHGQGHVDICIPQCPQATYFPPTHVDQLLCPYNVTANLSDPNCFGTFATVQAFHRCVPVLETNITEDLLKEVYGALNLQGAASQSIKLIGDLVRDWQYIATAAAVALALSFFWLFLLRLFADVIVWITILGVIGVIGILIFFVYNAKHNLQDFYNGLPVYAKLVSQQETLNVLNAVFYILCALDGIIIIVVVCMCNRIGIAIGVIKEASKAMVKIPSILLVPLGVALALVPLGVYWLYIGAYLATASTPVFDSNGDFVEYQADSTLTYMQLYHLFGGFWTFEFIHAIGECTIAGAIASWYWVHDKSEVPGVPVLRSLGHIFRYHLGSLLFGSLILAIIQFVRFLLHQFEKRVKASHNSMAVWAVRCVECILACFERFIKFLNKNAYIMIAIYGYSFCQGARRGFDLIASNILRVTALNVVSGFLIFLGKLFVSMVTTLIAFILLSRGSTDMGDYMFPVIVIAIESYAVSAAFFGVFDMACDTLLLCFCEDCDRNDGSAERPYYMSDALKSHVEHEGGCGCCSCC